jgi:hypothetical protein
METSNFNHKGKGSDLARSIPSGQNGKGGKRSSKRPDANMVRSLIKAEFAKNEEVKAFVVSANATTIDYSGSVTSLSDVAQGDTDSDRDGDSLTVKALEFRYNVVCADSNNAMRCIGFMWRPNISTPTPSNVLYALPGTISAPFTPFSIDYKEQFVVLWDNLHQLSSASATSACAVELHKFNHKIQYIAGSTVGSFKLFVLFVSDSAAASHPTTTWQSRLLYYDA